MTQTEQAGLPMDTTNKGIPVRQSDKSKKSARRSDKGRDQTEKG